MRCVLPCLLASVLAAGEAAPVLSLDAPDLTRTSTRLAAGPYGAIWRTPAWVQLRTSLGAKLPAQATPWLDLLGRAQEARLTLVASDSSKPDLILAIRVPPGADPPAADGMTVRRDGAWLLVGDAKRPLTKPAAVALDAANDVRGILDLPALAPVMDAADRTTYLAVLAQLGLTRIEAESTVIEQGLRQTMRAPGTRLPLRTADTTALAGLPATVQTLAVIGLDGPALVERVHGIARAMNQEAALTQADAALMPLVGTDLDSLLRACDGTWVWATTAGVPFPGMTLSAPASAALDTVITGLLDRLAPGTGARLVAQAKTQSVPLPMPQGVPLTVSLRRTATRWIVSTDALLIDTLAAAAPAPFPVATLWPKPDRAVVLAYGDTKTQLQLALGVLPMATMAVKDPEQRQLIGLVQQALVAAMPHVRPGSVLVWQDAQGLRSQGDNALAMDVVPMSVMAGMLLPAIQQARQAARRAHAASNMRQIVLAALVYSTDNDMRWPADLATIKASSDGELTEKIFVSPGHPEITAPYCYVRPVPSAKAMQPVLVQDPACNDGKGSNVVYADGHVEFVKGTALWIEAQRLAALPQAQEQGITGSDWQMQPEAPAEKPSEGMF